MIPPFLDPTFLPGPAAVPIIYVLSEPENYWLTLGVPAGVTIVTALLALGGLIWNTRRVGKDTRIAAEISAKASRDSVERSIDAASSDRRSESNGEVDGLCRALSAEIGALYNRHHSQFEPFFKDWDGKTALRTAHSASYEYFVTFDSNSRLIGKMTDTDLAAKIVVLYVSMKGHLDGLKLHSEDYRLWIDLETEASFNNLSRGALKVALEKSMLEMTEKLKDQYEELKKLIAEITPRLDDYRNDRLPIRSKELSPSEPSQNS